MKPVSNLALYQDGLKSDRNLYNGPFSKGGIFLTSGGHLTSHHPPVSIPKPELYHLSSSFKLNLMSTTSSLFNTTISSRNRSQKDTLTPNKLQTTQISSIGIKFNTTRDSNGSPHPVTLPDCPTDRKANDINSYLNHLKQTRSQQIESFRQRIDPVVDECEEIATKPTDRQIPSWLDGFQLKPSGTPARKSTNLSQEPTKASEKHRQSLLDVIVTRNSTLGSFQKAPSVYSNTADRLPSLHLNLQANEAGEDNGTVITPKTIVTPNTGTKMVSKGSRIYRGGSQHDGKFFSSKSTIMQLDEDNRLAKELAEEVCKNYKTFQESTSADRETKQSVTNMLKKEGVLNVFTKGNVKHFPLVMKVYSDMIEYLELARPRIVDQKDGYHMSPKNILMPTFFTKGKLIREKYALYKRINTSIVDLMLQFKIDGLRKLENNLLKAHEGFGIKKKELFGILEKKDRNSYYVMKKKFDVLEGNIPLYEYDDFGDKIEKLEHSYGDALKLDGSKRAVNKELNDILRKWKNTALNIS